MKIKKKAVLLIVLFFAAVVIVRAQVSIAPKIGLSYSKLGGDFTNAEVMPGAFFGGMINFRLHPLYSLQPGFLLSGKGTSLYYSEEDDDEILITYLEFPLNNMLTLQAGAGFMEFFAGPYAGLAINARYKYLEDDNNMVEKLPIGTSEGDEIKPLDVGVNLGVGYLFEGFEVQVAYSRSFSNVSNMAADKLFNRVVTVSMAYFFGFSEREHQSHWHTEL